MDETKGSRLRRGWMVFIALAVLTVVEFLVATSVGNAISYLLVIALIKAGLVVEYFMHVSQLWHREEG